MLKQTQQFFDFCNFDQIAAKPIVDCWACANKQTSNGKRFINEHLDFFFLKKKIHPPKKKQTPEITSQQRRFASSCILNWHIDAYIFFLETKTNFSFLQHERF